MRAILVLAVCGCATRTLPPLQDRPVQAKPPAAAEGIVRGTIAVDGDRACAIEASGGVACWGHGGAGPADATPVEVPGLHDVVGLAAGPSAMCAWTARGAVACWGPNSGDRFGPRLDDIVQVLDRARAREAAARRAGLEPAARGLSHLGTW